jgi:hypothetical protein
MNFSDIVTFTRASAAWERRSDGKYYSVGNNVARQADYIWNGTALEKAGLLIEGARTNLVLQSHRVDGLSPWGLVGSPVLDNTGLVALLNGKTPYRMTRATDSGSEFIRQTIGTFGSAPECLSAIVEAGSAAEIVLRLFDTTAGLGVSTYVFNLSTGAVTVGTQTGGTAQSAGAVKLSGAGPNGGATWLCYVVGTPATSGNARQVHLYPLGGTGEAGKSAIIHNVQHEIASFPSSPILTDAAAVTRAADVATVATAGWFADGQAGSLYVEAVFPDSAYADSRWIANVDDGSTANRHAFYRNSTNGRLYYLASKAGGVEASINSASVVGAAGAHKFAIGFAANDVAAYSNGTQVGTDSAFAVPTGLTTLRLGSGVTATANLFGYIRSLRYWPRRLSNAELAALTT